MFAVASAWETTTARTNGSYKSSMRAEIVKIPFFPLSRFIDDVNCLQGFDAEFAGCAFANEMPQILCNRFKSGTSKP